MRGVNRLLIAGEYSTGHKACGKTAHLGSLQTKYIDKLRKDYSYILYFYILVEIRVTSRFTLDITFNDTLGDCRPKFHRNSIANLTLLLCGASTELVGVWK